MKYIDRTRLHQISSSKRLFLRETPVKLECRQQIMFGKEKNMITQYLFFFWTHLTIHKHLETRSFKPTTFGFLLSESHFLDDFSRSINYITNASRKNKIVQRSGESTLDKATAAQYRSSFPFNIKAYSAGSTAAEGSDLCGAAAETGPSISTTSSGSTATAEAGLGLLIPSSRPNCGCVQLLLEGDPTPEIVKLPLSSLLLNPLRRWSSALCDPHPFWQKWRSGHDL